MRPSTLVLWLVLSTPAPSAAAPNVSGPVPVNDVSPDSAPADSITHEPGAAPTAESVAPADSATAPPEAVIVRRGRGNIGQRMVRAAKHFGEDCLYVAGSPFRLRARGLAELAVVAGTEAAIYSSDQEIMDAAQRNHDQPVLHALHKFGDILEDAGFMPHTLEAEGGVWLLGAAFHSARTQEISQELIEAHLIGGGIRNALKVLVGRAHPFEDRGPRVFEFGKGTSFPSGHTSIYFEAATVLSHHARAWPVTVLLYGAATAGAIQRVQARAHWASDVFLPMISGTLIGQTVVRRNEARASRWQPEMGIAGGGVQVGIGRRF